MLRFLLMQKPTVDRPQKGTGRPYRPPQPARRPGSRSDEYISSFRPASQPLFNRQLAILFKYLEIRYILYGAGGDRTLVPRVPGPDTAPARPPSHRTARSGEPMFLKCS